MKSIPFLLLPLIFLKYSDIHAQASIQYNYKIDYCRVLDSLTIARNTDQFSSYKDKLISKLEKASGIEAHCDKGFFGHIYRNEQAFSSDIADWREYFNCKIKTIILNK